MAATSLNGLFLGALFVLGVSPSALSAVSNPDQDLSVAGENPYELYHRGRPGAAIEAMRVGIASMDASDPSQVAGLLTDLMRMCAAARDAVCLEETETQHRELTEAMREGEEDPSALFSLSMMSSYLFSVAVFDSGDSEAIEQVLAANLVTGPDNPYLAPGLYVERQLLAAEMFLTLDRREESLRALDRAVASLVALDFRQFSAWYLADWLSKVIGLQVRNGRLTQAAGFYDTSRNFIAWALKGEDIEAARFRANEADLLYALSNHSEARESIESSLAIIKEFDLPFERFAGERAGLLEFRLGVCSFLGDRECVVDSLSSLDQEAEAWGSKSKELSEWLKSSSAVLRVFSAAGFGEEMDSLTRDDIRSRLEAMDESSLGQPFYSARFAALAILNEMEGIEGYEDLAVRAIETLIDSAESSYAGDLSAVYVPKALHRAIAAFPLAILAESETLSSKKVSAALQAAELITRLPTARDSDALAALAGCKTPTERQLVQSILRVASRKLHRQLQELTTRLAELENASGPNETETPQMDVEVRLQLSELGGFENELEDEISRRRLAARIPLFPGLELVQANLGASEDLAILSWTPRGLASVCIGREETSASLASSDPQQLLLDTKIVNAALTASHAPSDILDTQFPSSAAVGLYDLAVRPLLSANGGCASEGDLIHLAPAFNYSLVPAEVMLAEEPEPLAEGWDLRSAHWAVKDNSFSYAPSVGGFVASKILAREGERHGTEFFGMGAPELAGKTEDGVDREQFVTRGVVQGELPSDLSALPPLPNTRNELRALQESLSQTGEILVGEEATEAALRERFLNRYGLLVFSTHGLIREEIPGLREAALVLTPVQAADPMNDGLLTASEIADLSLDAQSVWLSACNTARFDTDLYQSEVQGLTTAFAMAGVPSSLVSLWPVETEVTEFLLTRTAAGMVEDQTSLARGLGKAKLDWIDDPSSQGYAHPRFWAPFVVFGDSRPDSANEVSNPFQEYRTEGPANVHGIEATSSLDGYFTAWNEPVDQGPWHLRVARRGIDGRERWRYVSEEISVAHVVMTDHRSVTIVGFTSNPETDSRIQIIRLDGDKGLELDRGEISVPGRSIWAIEAVGRQDGALEVLYMVTGPEGNQFQHTSEVEYHVARIGENLNVLADQEVPWKGAPSGQIQNATLVSTPSGTIVSLTIDPLRFSESEIEQDTYHNTKYCFEDWSTTVATLDPSLKSVEAVAHHLNLSIRDMTVDSDGEATLLAVRRGECSVKEDWVLGRFSSSLEEWQALYSDDGPLNTFANRLWPLSSGDIAIFTTVERAFDALQISEDQPVDQTAAAYDPRRLRSARILVLSDEFEEEREIALSAGSDVFLDYFAELADRYVLGGNIAGHGVWLTLEELK